MERLTGQVTNAASPATPCGEGSDPHFVFHLLTEQNGNGVFYINLGENAALSMVLIVLEGLRTGRKVLIEYQEQCLNGRSIDRVLPDPGGFVRSVEILKIG